ncbi:hypothetical protein I4U23_022127 [Adineta vaga]|nr:hypothetical protein I4U23_022127 [Adineta vaga]
MIIGQVSSASYNQPKLDPYATWSANAITFASSYTIGTYPYGIFVSTNNTIYVADRSSYRIRIWSNASITPTQSIYGTYMNAYSLFVTTNGDIYIDNVWATARVDKRSMLTNTSVPVMYINSICYGLFVDLTDTLYCSMYSYHQVVKRWIYDISSTVTAVAGIGYAGSGSSMLYYPWGIFVDINFDLYVADSYNNRIQLFRSGQLNGITAAGTSSSNVTISLAHQSVPTAIQTTTTTTSIKTLVFVKVCLPPSITLIPNTNTISSPTQFRRSEDFTIVSYIELKCNSSSSMITRWRIKKCNPSCLQEIPSDSNIITTFSELYIPSQILSYGLYEMKLTVTMINATNIASSSVAYIQITPSDITPNLIRYGTSIVTRGYQQDLQLDPGSYSTDSDGNTFNASNWKYKYYCRIYGLSTFPNLYGSLLTIDDMRNDLSNPSCLSLNRAGWRFDNSFHSSFTILSGSLQYNRTYQFMVKMENRQNSSLQATGYVLVKVEDTRPNMILIGCVIWTLCQPKMEFQRVNPTTQVALFSVCDGSCVNIQNIKWEVYFSAFNSSSNLTQWILFNQTIIYQNIWFFGISTTNFTSTNQLFLSNPEIELWRFEVIYTFSNQTSISSLNFRINQPPSDGSCFIDPLNGTASSLFTVSCKDYVDADGIKDYTVYGWTNDPTKRMIISFSNLPTFQMYLPIGDNQTSLLYLTVHIRDQLDCITEFNLSSVTVLPDLTIINDLINYTQNPSENIGTNPIIQLLASKNQNLVGQVMTLVAQQFNEMSNENIDKAISNGISVTSISVSSLLTESTQQSSLPLNQSVLDEFNKELNSRASTRDYLITFLTELPITTSNSIKLQASSLAQFTKATNELTRNTLTIASNRCYQLALALNSMKTKISFEDVQLASTDLLQCAANVLNAVNGPLQERTTILDLDSIRTTEFPKDYDTDLETQWANPNLFSDDDDSSLETIEKNRIIYYQKELANQIKSEMNKLISLLTSTLNIHLNIGQDFHIETSQVLMTLETKSIQSLSNQFTKTIGNAQSMMEPLAPFGNSKTTPNTNLSRSISFSILDDNQSEISIRTITNRSIEIIIPRDPNRIIPTMVLRNVTTTISNSTPHRLIFDLHYLNLTKLLPISIHWEIQPLNTSLAYLFIYRFDQIPQLNSSIKQIDGWTLFCPDNLTNDNIYTYYIDNQRTIGHQSVIYGLRELNATEIDQLCSNFSSITNPPISNEPINFTSNYFSRIYTSGCYYLNENQQWKSDGLLVGPLTNHNQTQCYSTHLTTFAGGFAILPESVDWNYVFANADFMKNKTIYLTVICVSIIYIILILYSRYYDKNDVEKLGVTILPDNHKEDDYFYQIIVFTGQRTNAGTKSNVHFVLHGDKNDTQIRTFADPHRQILQQGGVDAFLMSVPKSLGLLNCIRIWHDNSGKGSSSSWFLKYLIIRDLQTMEKYYFTCQRWFAVEKDDGKIERILPVASELEKRQFSFVLTKRTYHSISDGHLWFSIFSRPPSQQFTRVQRCTCCFVLLFVSMFLNIMYYDLSNETKSNNSANLSFGSLYISPQQIIIGIIVELFALIPSLLLIQLFRRLRPRRKHQSPIRQALCKVKPNIENHVDQQKSSLTFPWWCIFIAYGLCFVFVALSILFIIARGIEFGDEKTQKWLTSILSSFFSSILLTQPLKIVSLAIIFACFCRESNDDKEANELLDDNDIGLEVDEEYLHTIKNKSLFTYRSPNRANRLNETEVIHLRQQRLKQIQMRSIIYEILLYLCFLSFLYVIIYSNRDSNAFFKVNHLRKYFLNSRQIDFDYTKISTINQYWNWLENRFIFNLRAQQWYNGESPRNLSGFMDDKTNRLIGWATMRQLRVRTSLCHQQTFISSTCQHDYSYSNEDKDSYQPGWINTTSTNYNIFIQNAFKYQSNNTNYRSGGYIYEFRGRLSDLRSNLSQLHSLSWIDNQTRAIIVQLTLYNPNVQLFTAVTFLAEFLSSSGVFTSARFEPISFYAFTSIYQLVCTIIYMLMIFYFMWIELRSLFELKWKYFIQFWSFIQLGIIICSWTSLGIYIWRYQEYQRIGKLFSETNGYVYIDLQLISYINDLLTYLLSFCCFFGTIQLIKLCRFNQRFCLFIYTLQLSAKELLSFSFMFSIVFMSFICLFYFLFISKLPECSSLFGTAQMLFEMTLMKFDAHQLSNSAAFLGPFCWKIVTEEKIQVERDEQTHEEYYDWIEQFPEKIDQLLNALNQGLSISTFIINRAASSAAASYEWKVLAIGAGSKGADEAQKSLAGLGYKNAKLMGVGNSQESDQKIIAALKEKQWDAVAIGGYVNGYDQSRKYQEKDVSTDREEILLWFNRVLNIIHELAPKSKIILLKSPQDVHDGIQRIMGAEQIKT